MADHQGILWAGTDDGLHRLEDPATGRFHSWKGDPADPSPTDVRAMVEDSNGVLWLVSGSLKRVDPATGRFTAYTFDPLATGTAGRKDSPFLVKVGRPSPVSGDRVQLQQVLLNLVTNAMDAMSSVEDRARQLVITTLLHHEVRWHGHGTLDQPFHTSESWRPVMGYRQ